MFRIIVISCFMLISSGAAVRRSPLKSHLRVDYGRHITEGEYPYVVTLMRINNDTSSRLCTASVITEEWTLTAAHCVVKVVIRRLTIYVWYGNFTVSPLQTKLYSKVQNIYIHPFYREMVQMKKDLFVAFGNDIGLLRTQRINVKSYGRLSAVDHSTMIGLPVTYVGGGATFKPGNDHMRPLQVGEGTITKCSQQLKSLFHKNMICVSPKCSNKFQKGTIGDSGGPLIQDNKIIGVFIGACLAKSYAPVDTDIDWISNVMLSTD